MPYDKQLDKEVFSRAVDTNTGRIVVSVHSYNNGANKLQITREIKDKEDKFMYTRLGRLSKEEIDNILPLIQEAAEKV